MFNRQAYYNSRGDGHPVLEIAPRQQNITEGSPELLFVPLKHSHLSGTVTGPLAQFSLKQVFQFNRQENQEVIEALYRFPLPGDCAITGVQVHFGEVTIDTILKKRSEAENDYEAARREGRQALLVNRETADVFTLAINGIKPGQTIEIETSFTALARPEGSTLTLRIPLTTAPRFSRADESGHRQAQGQPLLSLRDPGHRFAMNIEIQGRQQVRAGDLPLTINYTAHSTEIQLAGGDILPDRDLLIQWQSLEKDIQPAMQIYSWQDPDDSLVYFLAGLQTPEAVDDAGIPREIIILVDHSGSMQGAKWAAADWAVKAFLNQLQAGDCFNLGVFHDYTSWWSEQPRTSTSANTQAAADFLELHKDGGGTELGVALEQALAMHRSPGQPSRQVLLITDAEVTDAGRILALVDQEARGEARRRINVLCIDSAPNALLASEIADRSGGLACFLTSNPREEDISTALDQILESFGRPLYADALLEVASPSLEASRQAVLETVDDGWRALDAGDLPAGTQRWFTGRFPADSRQSVCFELNATGLKESLKIDHSLDQSQGSPAFKALFGAGRLLVLEELQSFGLDSEETEAILKRLHYDSILNQTVPKPRYAENYPRLMKANIRELLASESLRYGLLSSETSFSAIRRETGYLAEYTVAVPSAQPAGWQFPAVGGGGFLQYKSRLRSAVPCASINPAPIPGPASGSGAPFLASSQFSGPDSSPNLRQLVAFQGKISLVDGNSLLLDSNNPDQVRAWPNLPARVIFKHLTVEFAGPIPDPATIDRQTILLLYCDDAAIPASRIRLAELLRQGGKRPLNLSWATGQLLKVILEDPSGRWDGVEIAVRLEW